MAKRKAQPVERPELQPGQCAGCLGRMVIHGDSGLYHCPLCCGCYLCKRYLKMREAREPAPGRATVGARLLPGP